MELLFIIIIGVFVFSLSSRVNVLESRVNELQNVLSRVQKVGLDLGIQINHEILPEVVEGKNIVPETKSEPVSKAVHTETIRKEKVSTEPDFIEKFFTWLATDWLVKLGGGIVLLGVIFFLSLAYNSVGDIGKVSIGFVVSGLIMIIGFWRSTSQVENGLIIYILGSAIATYVSYAAVNSYNLLDYNFGILLTVLISALSIFVALKFKSEATALLSNALLFATPMIFSSNSSDNVLLFGYLFFATIATVWVIVYSGWKSLGILSILSFAFYSMVSGFGVDSYMDSANLNVTLIAFATIALFLLVNLFDSIKNKGVEWGNVVTTVVASLMVLAWTYFGIPEDYQAISLITWSAFCMAILLTFAKNSNLKELLAIYGGASSVYLFVSMTYLLEGDALTLSFIFIGLLSSLLTHLVLRKYSSTLFSLVALLPGLVLSAGSASANSWDNWHAGFSSFPVSDFSVMLVEAAVLFILGIYYYISFRNENDNEVLLVPAFIGLINLSYLLYLIFGFDYRFVLMLMVLYMLISLSARLFNDYFERVIDLILAFNSIPLIFSFILMFEDVTEEKLLATLMIVCITSVFSVSQIKIRSNDLSKILLAVSAVFSAYWLWQALHFVIESEGLASLLAVSIYAIVGYFILFSGYKRGSESIVKIGKGILGLVALRVLFVDAWVYGIEFGVFICVVVGAILIATTFIVKDYVK